jgi:hypothetical protein
MSEERMVGGSATKVYGFAAPTRHDEPTSLAFQFPATA